MSNVLIGIIGVILFIGLALAGALILGDDFKTANSSSKGTAIMAGLSQVNSAVQMYQMKTGTIAGVEKNSVTLLSWLSPRFIKSLPASGATFYAWGPTDTIAYAAVGAATDSSAKDVCLDIQRNAGQISDSDPIYMADIGLYQAKVRWLAGCTMNNNQFLAFTRIN